MKKSGYRVLSQRSSESKLVKGQAFTTSFLNTSSGSLREPQGSNFDSWNLVYPQIIGYSSNQDSNLIFLSYQCKRDHDLGLTSTPSNREILGFETKWNLASHELDESR